MSFQLSPDREYFWDGSQWVRAVSPDGRWRWDGTDWRPAQHLPRSHRRLAALIGASVLVALVIAGIGVFAVTRLVPLEQSGLASFGLVCKGSADPAGAPVASGDTLCGYHLGAAAVTASCDGASVPTGLRARQETTAGEISEYDMVVDAEGCDLDTPLHSTIWLETRDVAPADVVVVADYVPHSDWGLIGITIGCDVTCLDFFIDPAGIYRLEEDRGKGNWHTVARGALPVFTISHLDQLNRLVVRYRDHGVQAFLNGYAVLRTTINVSLTSGLVSVYSDDRVGTEPARLHVRTLDVFAST